LEAGQFSLSSSHLDINQSQILGHKGKGGLTDYSVNSSPTYQKNGDVRVFANIRLNPVFGTDSPLDQATCVLPSSVLGFDLEHIVKSWKMFRRLTHKEHVMK
jgi:hypothetical protein